MKNKIVFITGAGAVLPWGAPETAKIDCSLKMDKNFITKNEQTVFEYIFNVLEKNYCGQFTVNFETVLNVLESLYEYYERPKSFISFCYDIKRDIESTFFPLKEIYECDDDFYCGKRDKGTIFNTKANYFKSMYYYYLKMIIEKVEEYDKNINDNKHKDLNDSFNKFINNNNNKNITRFYTLNYDEQPIKSCEGKFFNGFSGIENKKRINREKIISDSDCICYYNLHGSIYYHREAFEYIYDSRSVNYNSSVVSGRCAQDGKPLLDSNIITGLNKTTRLLFSPYREFYYSFYRDCYSADTIYVIGYSFGDNHIDEVIYQAMSEKKKVIIVDFKEEWLCESENIPSKGDMHKLIKEKGIQLTERNGSWLTDGSVYYYWKGFEKFLLNKEWEKV